LFVECWDLTLLMMLLMNETLLMKTPMKKPADLIVMLTSILSSPNPTKREELIKAFQDAVWSSPNPIGDENESEIFGELAYDLDFYEPDYDKRIEDASYYADDRLEEEIRKGLNDLKKAKRNSDGRD
jgi:hypothetical protein